jgi:hypothetical protein
MKWLPRRPLASRIRTLLAFLLLGAAANVAVAWGCGIWDTPYLDRWEPEMAEIAWLGKYVTGHNEIGFDYGYRSVGDRWISTEWYNPDDRSFVHVGSVETGWPLRSMAGEWVITQDRGVRTIMLMEFPSRDPLGPRHLALRPLWPGFAINTVFYAAILWGGWLLFAAPFAVRRRRRIKRGLCPACAYPVGASDLCTECGEPVKPFVS